MLIKKYDSKLKNSICTKFSQTAPVLQLPNSPIGHVIRTKRFENTLQPHMTTKFMLSDVTKALVIEREEAEQ